jgi:hypothetical protein
MDAILRQVEPEVKQKIKKNRGQIKLSPEYRRTLKAQFLHLNGVLKKFKVHELDPDRLKTYDLLLAEIRKVQPDDQTRAASFLRRSSELILLTVANSRWRLAQLRESTGQLNRQVTSRQFSPEYVKMVRVLHHFEQDLKEASDVYAQHPQDATELNLLRLMSQVPLLQERVKREAILQLASIEKSQMSRPECPAPAEPAPPSQPESATAPRSPPQ